MKKRTREHLEKRIAQIKAKILKKKEHFKGIRGTVKNKKDVDAIRSTIKETAIMKRYIKMLESA